MEKTWEEKLQLAKKLYEQQIEQMVGKVIWTRDLKRKGKILSICWNRHCAVEDCKGRTLAVRWDDGSKTYPCSAGCSWHAEGEYKIG